MGRSSRQATSDISWDKMAEKAEKACFIAFPKLCIEWCKENNLLSSSVSKTCVKTKFGSWQRQSAASGDGSVSRFSRKNCNDSLQSARTHINFLTVNFP